MEDFYKDIAKDAEAKIQKMIIGHQQFWKTRRLYQDGRWTWMKNHDRVCCIEGKYEFVLKDSQKGER